LPNNITHIGLVARRIVSQENTSLIASDIFMPLLTLYNLIPFFFASSLTPISISESTIALTLLSNSSLSINVDELRFIRELTENTIRSTEAFKDVMPSDEVRLSMEFEYEAYKYILRIPTEKDYKIKSIEYKKDDNNKLSNIKVEVYPRLLSR